FSRWFAGYKLGAVFTSGIVTFCLVSLFFFGALVGNSYFRAKTTNLNAEIAKKLEATKDLEWQFSVNNRDYIRVTSSSELIKKAQELKMSVVTSDKIISEK
ncbi:hypothetical protein J5834_00480, partial [bacterium]|nr:hypothetical protein [bacterium]